jgi:hypothetical protein
LYLIKNNKHEKVYSFIAFAMLTGALVLNYGCGKKETIKKTFNLVVELDFPVDASTVTSYDQTQILDVSAQDVDFAKHKEDVISIVLDSVKCYTREYVIPNDNSIQINNGAIKIGSVGGNPADEVTISDVQNINLMAIYEQPAAIKVGLNNAGITKFADLLTNSPYTAQLRFMGDVSAPVSFKMKAKFYFTFQAWIL